MSFQDFSRWIWWAIFRWVPTPRKLWRAYLYARELPLISHGELMSRKQALRHVYYCTLRGYL